MDNEYAFIEAFKNGHLQVAQWLQSLNPNSFILVIENNKIIEYATKKYYMGYTFKDDFLEWANIHKHTNTYPYCRF